MILHYSGSLKLFFRLPLFIYILCKQIFLGSLKPLQNWHLWQISSLGLRSKS
ncbi:MAG: hypothetical protein IJV35_03580 [Neisseriaceae bacterium]|nr:hypothetical protein [Neisseriaceae bacterium]